MENKMKQLEEEVAALRRANQPSGSGSIEIRETRLQANRNYFDGRKSTYVPRCRGGYGGNRGNAIASRRGYQR